MNKAKKFLLTTALVGSLMSSPAFASDEAAMAQLEAKLTQAIKLIQAQSKQVSSMQQEINNLKKNQVKAISANTAKVSSADLARLQPAAGSVPNSELEERLTEIEDTVYALDERAGGSKAIVKAFDAKKFDIGGFINTAYTYAKGEDGSAQAWNRQNFEILIRADLNKQWSAFFAGGFLREGDIIFNDAGKRRDPDFTIVNKNPQIIGWVNYKHNDKFNVKLGRMISPHGIVNIEHFPATLLDQEQPQFLRPFSGDTIFPNFVTGVQAHGNFFFGDNALGYNTYFAAKQGAPEEPLIGGRLSYNLGNYGVTLGVNGLTGSRSETTNSDYTMYGADILIDKGSILWKNEIYKTSEDGAENRFAYYTQPAWRINDKWTAFYRYDYLDDGIKDGADDGDVTEHVLGLNFLPHPNVRLRATGTRRQYEGGGLPDADLDIYQFSSTFSF